MLAAIAERLTNFIISLRSRASGLRRDDRRGLHTQYGTVINPFRQKNKRAITRGSSDFVAGNISPGEPLQRSPFRVSCRLRHRVRNYPKSMAQTRLDETSMIMYHYTTLAYLHSIRT